MITTMEEIRKYKIAAQDGEIGKLVDLYFDDAEWTVRYLVVDTGGWLGGRQVLVSPRCARSVDHDAKEIPCDLTTEQVRNSPDINADKPVSRQHEIDLHGYYGWPVYWSGSALAGQAGTPAYPAPGTVRETHGTQPQDRPSPALHGDRMAREELVRQEEAKGDPSLRSFRHVDGYTLHAKDGEMGKLDDLVVEVDSWAIRYAVVKTGTWFTGKKVLIAPAWIDRIDWADEAVYVNVKRDTIKDAPPWDPDRPLDREYEDALYRHYTKEAYWDSRTAR